MPDCSVVARLFAVATAVTVMALIGSGPAAATESCAISSASLTWGFKESFRGYISGTIANGEWTVANGAEYETPLFSWPNGTGPFDAATGDGSLSFTGSIEFTGHGGVLDTTVANPRVQFAGAQAILELDVEGTTQQDVPIDEKAVAFAALDLSKADIRSDGGTVTLSGIPAVLTDDGAHAFGTYKSGEEFDPVLLEFTTSEACAASFVANEESAEGAGERILVGVLVGAGAIVLVGVALFVWRWRVRGRQSHQG